MLCSYCKVPCRTNDVSCPNCGAPLSSTKTTTGNIWGTTSKAGPTATDSNTFEASRKAPPNFQKRKADTTSKFQQLNFIETGQSDNWEQGTPQPLFETYHPLSSQAQSTQPLENQSIDPRQALLPIPYQEMPPAVGQTTMSLQLIPDQAIEHLLPAMPAMPETVHVPPIYTKPRPITPKYQAISSFVSFIIITLLL